MTLLVAFLICFSAVVFLAHAFDAYQAGVARDRGCACPSGQWNSELLLVSLSVHVNGIGQARA